MRRVKRGINEKPPKDLWWCIHPDCDLHAEHQFLSTDGQKGLEDHWIEKHGAVPKPVKKKVKGGQPELFDREPYFKG